MTSAVNGLPKTLPQRSDFPWRKGAQARRTEKNVVGLCLTQFRQQNPYRRVRPIGDEKYPLVDDFGTLLLPAKTHRRAVVKQHEEPGGCQDCWVGTAPSTSSRNVPAHVLA